MSENIWFLLFFRQSLASSHGKQLIQVTLLFTTPRSNKFSRSRYLFIPFDLIDGVDHSLDFGQVVPE
jgi:hypothetical protein